MLGPLQNHVFDRLVNAEFPGFSLMVLTVPTLGSDKIRTGVFFVGRLVQEVTGLQQCTNKRFSGHWV